MKGLCFSEAMIKSWLAGNKTVTRRLMKKQPEFDADGCYSAGLENPPIWFDIYDLDGDLMRVKAPYRPGETVYIKETWAVDEIVGHYLDGSESGEVNRKVYYKANHSFPNMPAPVIKWKSPRFMPEWAARSHALIVSVRPERVQEITWEEVKKEGITIPPPYIGINYYDGSAIEHPDIAMSPEDHFARLWETLHPGSWNRNDWVWRIELEKEGK